MRSWAWGALPRAIRESPPADVGNHQPRSALHPLAQFIRVGLFEPEVREHLLCQEVELIRKHLHEESEADQEHILGQLRSYGLGYLLDS